MPGLTDIAGVGPSLAAACVKNNYRTISKIAAAKPSDLTAVPGISAKGAMLIIASAKSLMKTSPSSKTSKNKTRKAGKAKKLQEVKVSDSKDKDKIKKLKKKIKKLKKEKKKIIAKDTKKAKNKTVKKSGKKK